MYMYKYTHTAQCTLQYSLFLPFCTHITYTHIYAHTRTQILLYSNRDSTSLICCSTRTLLAFSSSFPPLSLLSHVISSTSLSILLRIRVHSLSIPPPISDKGSFSPLYISLTSTSTLSANSDGTGAMCERDSIENTSTPSPSSSSSSPPPPFPSSSSFSSSSPSPLLAPLPLRARQRERKRSNALSAGMSMRSQFGPAVLTAVDPISPSPSLVACIHRETW
mmetsp:Transcript_12346/g.33084  ORF Transcript_12346/g.33084 Transcript_12346/m.33084 type:complete len:221 (-) Transcript_12346:47-709(-)